MFTGKGPPVLWNYCLFVEGKRTFSHLTSHSHNFLEVLEGYFCIVKFKLSFLIRYIQRCHDLFLVFGFLVDIFVERHYHKKIFGNLKNNLFWNRNFAESTWKHMIRISKNISSPICWINPSDFSKNIALPSYLERK